MFTTGTGGTVDITITTTAQDLGSGLDTVALHVDGTQVGVKADPPWEWTAAFPSGGFIVEAVATDSFPLTQVVAERLADAVGVRANGQRS